MHLLTSIIQIIRVRSNDAVRASTQSESSARFEQLSDKSTQQHSQLLCAALNNQRAQRSN
jgi:hypothetical protein